MVVGNDAAAVGRTVRERREAGERVAGFIGIDEEQATVMAVEMFGGIDHLVVLVDR